MINGHAVTYKDDMVQRPKTVYAITHGQHIDKRRARNQKTWPSGRAVLSSLVKQLKFSQSKKKYYILFAQWSPSVLNEENLKSPKNDLKTTLRHMKKGA